jgi:hypothetical protein
MVMELEECQYFWRCDLASVLEQKAGDPQIETRCGQVQLHVAVGNPLILWVGKLLCPQVLQSFCARKAS